RRGAPPRPTVRRRARGREPRPHPPARSADAREGLQCTGRLRVSPPGPVGPQWVGRATLPRPRPCPWALGGCPRAAAIFDRAMRRERRAMSTSVGAGGRRPWLVLGLIALGIALAGLLVARVGVERRALRRALPQLEGRIELPGLADELVIVRDVRGIAHVRAKNEADAWFGLGVVHAQDRLAQMTWLVRAARGRTAEVIGRDGLEIDRRSRTLGLGRLADRRAQQLDPAVRGLLEAYSAGVNAWIAR